MNHQVILESQQYFGAHAFSCQCCGFGISTHAESCGKCHMPVSISLTAEERGVRPTFLPILGVSGAGKTVYMGMLLDMLSKSRHGISGQPNNSFSISIQQETMTALERRRFPEKTPTELEDWNWVHCALEFQTRKKKRCLLDMAAPDLAGEALAMELDHPNTYPVLQNCVAQATGIILLMDASKVSTHSTEEDMMATKIAAYVYGQAPQDKKNRNTKSLPFALTFTKTDLCPESAADPVGFARDHLPSFCAYVQRSLSNVEYFATSVVGSVTQVDDQFGDYYVPLHVQPRGVIEPLAWVVNR